MRKITANVSNEKGKLDKFFSHCIGAGRAGEIMRKVPYDQLCMVQKECSFKYIRFHGLFHEEMNIVTKKDDGSLKFNFNYIDMLFDELLEIGIKPIVELGLMPKILAEKETTVFWWKMCNSFPKDVSEWALLVLELVKHLTVRYGKQEIRQWYFEIWNEPNHPSFFTESKDIGKYFKIYDAAAIAIKNVDKYYRVGGPSTAGLQWIKEMIDHCKESNIPLDFVSSHHYGVRGAFDADGKSTVFLCAKDDLCGVVRNAAMRCKEADIPFFITEWSSSYMSRDPIHDCYISAPYILYQIKNVMGYVQSFSYWVYTDIFEEVSPPPSPFHGGFGLINTQGLKKPSYYAYKFLSALGDTELYCEDNDAFICKSEEGIQLLFWNLELPKQDVDNVKYFSRPILSRTIESAEIILSGLDTNKTYTVESQTVGYMNGDVYDAYLQCEDKALEMRETSEYLKQVSIPKKINSEYTTDDKGTLEFIIPQTENCAILLKVSAKQ